jgi:hypothetical protein
VENQRTGSVNGTVLAEKQTAVAVAVAILIVTEYPTPSAQHKEMLTALRIAKVVMTGVIVVGIVVMTDMIGEIAPEIEAALVNGTMISASAIGIARQNGVYVALLGTRQRQQWPRLQLFNQRHRL